MSDYSTTEAVFPLVAYPITGVDTGTEQFVIAGDQTDRILVDDVLSVIDSTGNDGEYTVASTSYAAGPDETTITVNEDITDATVDGKVLHDEIADETPVTLSHDDAADRDAAIPDQVAGAHVQRLANEVRAVEKTVNIALGFEIIDAGGLVIYHSGGILNTSAGAPAEFAPGKLTLPDNDDSYIEVDPSAISQNITGFSAGKFPLAIVTTAAGSITRIEDKRAALGGGGAGGVPPPSIDNRLVRVNGVNGEIQQAAAAILDDNSYLYNIERMAIGTGSPPTRPLQVEAGAVSVEGIEITGTNYPTIRCVNLVNAAGGEILLESSTKAWAIYLQGSELRFWDGADRVKIASGGAATFTQALSALGICTTTGGLSLGPSSELTLDVAGAITVTGPNHRIDTYLDAATDDVVTINGMVDGEIVTFRAENNARVPTLKDGTGNLDLGADIPLDNVRKTIALIYDAGLGKVLRRNGA